MVIDPNTSTTAYVTLSAFGGHHLEDDESERSHADVDGGGHRVPAVPVMRW